MANEHILPFKKNQKKKITWGVKNGKLRIKKWDERNRKWNKICE